MPVEIDESAPVPEPGETNLNELVGQLEIARGNFFTTVTSYSQFPTQRNAARIDQTVDLHEAALMRSVEFILDDEETEVPQRSNVIAGLLKTEDRQRVERFSALCGDGATFKEDTEDQENISEALTAALQEATKEHVLEIVAVGYRAGLEVDLTKLIEHVEKTRNGKALDVARKIGKTTLDVAKIAAGVAIGIRLSRRRE